MHGQDQGAQARARALGIGVAGDHEFLAQAALELDPVRAAPRGIGAAAPLADHALQAQLAGSGHQVGGRGVKGLAETKAVRRRLVQQGLQLLAALLHGLEPQVLAVLPQQVKREEHQVVGALAVKGVLQGLEVRAAVAVQHQHLAIHPARL